MKIKKGKILVLLFALLCSNFFAQGNNKAVLDFNVQGIKLGCSLKDFLNTNRFSSKYEASYSQPEIGTKVYTSENVPNIDCCIFRFFDEKLYSVKVMYSDETAAKMGGFYAIVSKLIERYGQKYDAIDEKTKDPETIFEGSMNFPQLNRYLYAKVYRDMMSIEVIDTKTKEEMNNKKKSNMNLGF